MAEATPPQITRMEDIPLDNQSVELPVRERIVSGSAVLCVSIALHPRQDQPGVRCSRLLKDGQPVSYIYEDCRTLYDTFQRGKKESR